MDARLMQLPTVAEIREAEFQVYLEQSVPYMDAVREAGAAPWFDNPEKLAKLQARGFQPHPTDQTETRRRLFLRRYERPAPPAGLGCGPWGSAPVKTIEEIAA